MLNLSEMLNLLERFDRFLVHYAVDILRLIGDAQPRIEQKLLEIVKGTVFPITLEAFSLHVRGLTDPDLGRQMVTDALHERRQLLQELTAFLVQESGLEIAHRPLLAAVEREEPTEQAFAITILAIRGHPRARESLEKGLPQFSRLLRWGILTLLDRLGDPQWMPFFLHALEDPDPGVVRAGVLALGRSGTALASERLRSMLGLQLEGTPEGVVIAVVQALALLRDPSALPSLLDLLQNTGNPRIRATLVSAVGEFSDPSVLPVLGQALANPEPRVRANAVIALKKQFKQTQPDEILVQAIRGLLLDPDHRVRADSIQCLWEIGRLEDADQIFRMMSSSVESDRTSGAYLCGKLRLEQYQHALVGLTSDASWNVRKTAALALLSLGPTGQGVLESLLVKGTPDQQVCAAFATGLADDPRGVDWLLQASRSGSEMAERATDLLLRLSKPADL